MKKYIKAKEIAEPEMVMLRLSFPTISRTLAVSTVARAGFGIVITDIRREPIKLPALADVAENRPAVVIGVSVVDSLC